MSRSQAEATKRGRAGDEWFTPRELIERLGPFDLDPATSEDRPWDTAAHHLTAGGLEAPWSGFVWLNPPYSDIRPWLAKLSEHKGGGIALVPAATGAVYWQLHVYPYKPTLHFLSGRPRFVRADGSTPGPAAFYCVLIGYGATARERLKRLGPEQTWVRR
jgi:hypothetical protein